MLGDVANIGCMLMIMGQICGDDFRPFVDYLPIKNLNSGKSELRQVGSKH